MEALKMERNIVFVTGSRVGQGQEMELHTSTCNCGNRIVAAKKEQSLKYFTGNEKYKAKCCGSTLHYNGLKTFKDGELKEETKIEEPKIKEVKKTSNKKGMTKGKIIEAIKNNIENIEYIQSIENEYTELFFETAKFYIPDPIKAKVEMAIKLVKPEFQLPIGKRMRNKM